MRHLQTWIAVSVFALVFAGCGEDSFSGDETGAEETGAEETGAEGIDCNAYCTDVGECAEEWGTTTDALVPECVEGCLDAPPIEQHVVAECLDAAATCDDVSNCLPDSGEEGDICDEYCGPVGDCAEEWGAATEDVLDSCLDGCTEASAEEQLSVAGCLDASENCDDIFACIPE